MASDQVSLADLLASAKQLAKINSSTSKPELEIIMQSGYKTPGVTSQQFINTYKKLSEKATKNPIEFMVDQIHSNAKDDKKMRSNNTRVSNIYTLKDNEPGYKRIKMINIIKKRFQPYEGNGFKVVLASEETFDITSKNVVSTGNEYARIKVRTSFSKWESFNDWKIDVTAVWGMQWPTQINHLKTIVETCFNSWKNVTNDVNEHQLNKFNTFEVEAEYIGDYELLTEEKINELVAALNNILQNKEVNNDMDILYKETAQIAKLINHYRINSNMTVKKLSAMPIELNKNLWKGVYPPLGWFVTDKADGKRTIIHLYQKTILYISDKVVSVDLQIENQPRTIVDCEEIDGKFYVFDVLYFKDNKSFVMPFQRRYTELEPAAKLLADITKKDIQAKPFNRFPVMVSDSDKLDDEIRKPIEAMWNRTRPYEIDGLIFNSSDATYLDTKMYKWKPNNSIDFLAIKCPVTLLGQAPYINKANYTLYLLFVTIRYEEYLNIGISVIDGYDKVFPQYCAKYGNAIKIIPPGGQKAAFPMQFSPSFYPRAYLYYAENGLFEDSNSPRIFELYVDSKHKGLAKIVENGDPLPWTFIKIREDRQTDVLAGGYFGNYVSVAESVAQNIINPFPMESLWETSKVYFQENKDLIYSAPTGFNSFVKSHLFTELKPDFIVPSTNKLKKTYNVLLDIAAGQGADIGRYKNGEFSNVIAMDRDIDALSELSRRKYSDRFHSIPAINTVLINFNESNIAGKLKNIGLPYEFDAISCNFSIHYVAKLEDFVKNISELLKVGGKFGFTCFDGGRVNKLLIGKNMGDSWIELAENNFVKYQIQKMYIGNDLANTGQVINVKLPFSNELYAENLVNIDYLISLFEKKRIKLRTRKQFNEFLDSFEHENLNMYSKLTNEDKVFIGLYEFVIVERF
jgi:SAM-dependent methyltransferase